MTCSEFLVESRGCPLTNWQNHRIVYRWDLIALRVRIAGRILSIVRIVARVVFLRLPGSRDRLTDGADPWGVSHGCFILARSRPKAGWGWGGPWLVGRRPRICRWAASSPRGEKVGRPDGGWAGPWLVGRRPLICRWAASSPRGRRWEGRMRGGQGPGLWGGGPSSAAGRHLLPGGEEC